MNLIIINHQNSILDIHSSWITHDKSPIFPGFSPGPEIPAASTAASKRVNRVPRTCPPPGGARPPGCVPRPLGRRRASCRPGATGATGRVLGGWITIGGWWCEWMGNLGIWNVVICIFGGGNWKILDRSYLKVDIFMDELFTWIQVWRWIDELYSLDLWGWYSHHITSLVEMEPISVG